ncbi:MAG: ankyrin repeat domain-containing protein [Nitrospinaceae bacterium]
MVTGNHFFKIKIFSSPGRGVIFFPAFILLTWVLGGPLSLEAFNLDKVFYQAIHDADKNEINSLLTHGARINGGHYLNQVALDRNKEMFQYLLEKGADINMDQIGPLLKEEEDEDVGGKTPLCTVLSNFLSSKKDIRSIEDTQEWVEFLLEKGANPNKMCYGKFTPLMMVTGKGADPAGLSQWERLETAMKVVVILLKYGANLNLRAHGYTALDFATESNNLNMVMFLRDLGASE